MKSFTETVASLAGFATLALAALPVAALATAGHAAPYAAQTVQISDLNLSTLSGQAVLAQRAEAAARHFCREERSLATQASCQAGVRAEVSEKAAGRVTLASRD